jgi:NTE family protein
VSRFEKHSVSQKRSSSRWIGLPLKRRPFLLLLTMAEDCLATDIEHLDRLNQLLGDGRISQSSVRGCEKMRPLASFLMTPSVDLSQLAEQHQKDMPYLIQYFVNSLGRDAASCSDLMSYLLFTSKYTSALIEIGYNDTSRRIDEIESFLYSSVGGNTDNLGQRNWNG